MESERTSAYGNNTNVDFTQSTDDDPLIDGPLVSQDALESVIKREFQKLPTHWAVGVLSFLHVVYVVLSIAITVFCWISDEHTPQCTAALQGIDSKTVVLLGKVALWVMVFIYDRFVQHHHGAVRRRGYLDFYRLTRGIKNLPLLIHSAGNALILTVVAPSSLLDASVKNLSVYLMLSIICLELLLSLICLLKYAVHVLKFNSKKPHPDITEQERSHGCSSEAHTETGFRDGSSLEDVVEKQADLIDYLKQHNSVLSRRILTLTDQQIRA
ncbi:transmembrane protein 192 [Ctenopharyngodon idella]|uniref:transmembrane protein 192 n=1 Tax=Ctenopharyngodon idella TaxID=7959 RepID=UPI0022329E92|nr:transmembrane protein 192 [Ctenopharyngodon idella]